MPLIVRCRMPNSPIDELDRAIADLVGAWAVDRVMPAFQELWPRWRQAVGMAAHRGVLCFGQNRGRRVTYTNPRRWLPVGTPDATNRPWLCGSRSPGKHRKDAFHELLKLLHEVTQKHLSRVVGDLTILGDQTRRELE
jgi:hypothetical protein